MNREEKAALVDEIAAELSDADAVFAVDYRGISVPQAAELRASLRDADARFRVVKNRLTKRAAEKAGTDSLVELLEGPIALTLVKGDAALAAKTITRFGRQHELLEYKGGLMEGQPLDPDQFMEIARLPALDVLRGQFTGVVASPLTGLVRGLGSMISGLAIQLKQIEEQGLVQGEPEPAPKPEPAEGEPQAPSEEQAAPEPEEQATEGEAEPEPEPAPEEEPEPAADDEPAGEGDKETEPEDKED